MPNLICNRRTHAGGTSLDQSQKQDKPAFKPRRRARTALLRPLLLTDGQTTTGPDPIESARMAADRGVKVYTVSARRAANSSGGGWSMRVRLDEASLKTIA